MDHFSPLAPAHIRVLVLPVGQADRQRFLSFLGRLQKEACLIPLKDVEQKGAQDGFFLSPTAFPAGSLLYRFSAAAPSDQHQQLSPFEIFREPLLVLGVVDELKGSEEEREKELAHATAYLKERHPRVVYRQLLVLQDTREDRENAAHNVLVVRNAGHEDDPTLIAAIRELSARFLIELTSYAKAMQVAPSVQTPGQTARSLQRTTSLRESDRLSDSGRSTPPSISSPTEEGSPPRPPSRAPPMPATSFEQMASANRDAGIIRSNSRASNQSDKPKKSKPGARASSQDRVSIQGFGTNTSQEKLRVRGKARVGIVLSSIYMMAGHWLEALRMLVDHTSKAKAMSDQIWHAKGLENMAVCMLLLAWAGVDFQVPSLCDPVADRSSAANAARIAAETKAATEGTKQQLQLFRLSVALPELAKLMLSLFRSTEGSLELPFLQVSEVSVRCSRLLAALSSADGKLDSEVIRSLIFDQDPTTSSRVQASFWPTSALGRTKSLSKSTVADMLASAVPSDDDGLAVGDHIRILAGVASTYAALGLDRKKAMTIKDMVVRLTVALIQARKLGAAEIGIHPAASLSTDTGADTLLTIAQESSGINSVLADVSKIYGADLAAASLSELSTFSDQRSFGSSNLKFDLLRELAAFCEASPDPSGVLLLTTSLLRAAGPNAAIDSTPQSANANDTLSREEQVHLSTVITRTVAVSKHIGLTEVLAVYWDPFIVRGVLIPQPSGPRAIIDRTKLKNADITIAPTGLGNPLLYDPNASRPGTAVKQTFIMVENEPVECLVTLQNPYEISIDIEHLNLVTEGAELECIWGPTTLGPLRLQQVSIIVVPKSPGAVKIVGCSIKMHGCTAQIFHILPHAWSAKSPLTIKSVGLQGRVDCMDFKKLDIEPEIISATVISKLPMLVSKQDTTSEPSLMLLEGERRQLELTVRNDSAIAARIFEIADASDVLRLAHSNGLNMSVSVEPQQSKTFHFDIIGRAGVTRTLANFFYSVSNSTDTKHARVLSVAIDMTVNAALQILQLEVFRENFDTGLLVTFDLRNAWPKTISYDCRDCDVGNDRADQLSTSDLAGQLTPGEIRRVHLHMSQKDANIIAYEGSPDVVWERLLSRINVSWTVNGRSGIVDVQSLSPPPESLGLLRGAPIQIFIQLPDQEDSVKHRSTLAGSFVRVQVELRNRGRRSGGPVFISLTPRATKPLHQGERQLAAAGPLKRAIPPLDENASANIDFVICPLLAGILELDAVVREEGANWHSTTSVVLIIENK